jgi:hypothetical protein
MHLGQTAGSGATVGLSSSAEAAVLEPASLIWLALAAPVLALKVRRGREATNLLPDRSL